ncbi:MAG: CBS domain-containing protein [Ruminiclostridium sp.]|nr:CBS domain-containing protein [Ruminiclostridium sp.]
MNLLFLLHPKSMVAHLVSDCTARQGLEKMRAHGYTAIPVINPDGEYIGTVSEGDFLWALVNDDDCSLKKLEKIKLTDIMRGVRDSAVTVTAHMDELLYKIMEQNFVPVTDDRNIFIGIVTRKDIIKYYYEKEKKADE